MRSQSREASRRTSRNRAAVAFGYFPHTVVLLSALALLGLPSATAAEVSVVVTGVGTGHKAYSDTYNPAVPELGCSEELLVIHFVAEFITGTGRVDVAPTSPVTMVNCWFLAGYSFNAGACHSVGDGAVECYQVQGQSVESARLAGDGSFWWDVRNLETPYHQIYWGQLVRT